MSDMVQVPRATLEYWLANVCDEPVSYVSGMRLDMQRILLEADDLSTEPPNVDTSGERVDDVDTFPEDSVNDPDCVEVSPENVITTFHPMPPYVVSMTDNGDGSYHEELKACPKCGIVGKVVSDDPDCGYRKAYMVECDCGEWFDTEAEAIAAWNRRDPDWQGLAQEAVTAIARINNTPDDDTEGWEQAVIDACALLQKFKAVGLEVGA